MTPADQITGKEILDRFSRAAKAKRRSAIAEGKLKGHATAEWLMAMQGLGGSAALEIICRVWDYCIPEDETPTLGEVLEEETDTIQVRGT